MNYYNTVTLKDGRSCTLRNGTAEDGQALLIANVSEKRDRPLKIDAGDYAVDKCMTVNEACEWVEIPLPEKIVSGSMLYITFVKR